jgi:hypothetical protein
LELPSAVIRLELDDARDVRDILKGSKFKKEKIIVRATGSTLEIRFDADSQKELISAVLSTTRQIAVIRQVSEIASA